MAVASGAAARCASERTDFELATTAIAWSPSTPYPATLMAFAVARCKVHPAGWPSNRSRMAALMAMFSLASGIEVCPGEGARYGDFKCNHDGTHRVRPAVDQSTSAPPRGARAALLAAHQPEGVAVEPHDHDPPTPVTVVHLHVGAASLIEQVGCDNVHLRCEATDVQYVLSSYHDGGHKLDAAHECLRKKCELLPVEHVLSPTSVSA